MKLFISYSHEDTAHLDEFKKHLVTLERQKVLMLMAIPNCTNSGN